MGFSGGFYQVIGPETISPACSCIDQTGRTNLPLTNYTKIRAEISSAISERHLHLCGIYSKAKSFLSIFFVNLKIK
jgi:hypothetical protein